MIGHHARRFFADVQALMRPHHHQMREAMALRIYPAKEKSSRLLALGYSGALAAIAGYVNSVALLVWLFPVGNLTALTTSVGMHASNPLLYSGRMIAVIVIGFLIGVMGAGVVLAPQRGHTGPRHGGCCSPRRCCWLLRPESNTL